VAQHACFPDGVSPRHWGIHDMTTFRKFHSIAALCGDGLRPELQALFERLAVDPHSELFTRNGGMVQSGPDPISARARLPASRAISDEKPEAGDGSLNMRKMQRT
jgi:hypothetical protein